MEPGAAAGVCLAVRQFQECEYMLGGKRVSALLVQLRESCGDHQQRRSCEAAPSTATAGLLVEQRSSGSGQLHPQPAPSTRQAPLDRGIGALVGGDAVQPEAAHLKLALILPQESTCTDEGVADGPWEQSLTAQGMSSASARSGPQPADAYHLAGVG